MVGSAGGNEQRLRAAARAVFETTELARAMLRAEAGADRAREQSWLHDADLLRRHAGDVAEDHAAARVRRSAEQAGAAGAALAARRGDGFVPVGELVAPGEVTVPLILPLFGPVPTVIETADTAVAAAAIDALIGHASAIHPELEIIGFDPYRRRALSDTVRRAETVDDLVVAIVQAAPAARLLLVLDDPSRTEGHQCEALADALGVRGHQTTGVLSYQKSELDAIDLPGRDRALPMRWYGNGIVWQGCPRARVSLDSAPERDPVRPTPVDYRLDYLGPLADITAALDQCDAAIDAAEYRHQSAHATIARHRLDRETDQRRRMAVVDQMSTTATELLVAAAREDLLVPLSPTMALPDRVTAEGLVAAQELAVHELRRHL
ncbi:hypothetical protein [Nocardia sp. NPDC004415]